jgi:hypothetical protein
MKTYQRVLDFVGVVLAVAGFIVVLMAERAAGHI